MAVEQVTNQTTEADLESRINAALRHAFPLLPSEALRHQIRFSFTFGGKEIVVDGASREAALARADVIVYYNDKPLAVLELKRPSVPLTEDDTQQGLSYARVLFPSPPLVVVSNGTDLRLLETHTGAVWTPGDRTGQAVAALIQNAARASSEDLKKAVDTLMGTNPDIWVQAVQKTSAAAIAELSGVWSQRLLPFVEGFLIPRKATALAKSLLKNGKRLLIIHGQPMIGKSNVLRELAQMADENRLAVLFIGFERGASILQQLADILAQELEWPVTKDEARNWLKGISRADGRTLVLAIDGIGLNFDGFRDEIDDLASDSFGKNLAIVLELDSVIANRVMKDSTGRRLSRIGRRASGVPVLQLDADEFCNACVALQGNKIGMTKGSQLSPELRLPWVLRAITSHLDKPSDGEEPSSIPCIPPLLSLHLMQLTRDSFKNDHELRRRFQGVAKAVLEDSLDQGRPVSLILEAISTFVFRRSSLENHISHADVDRLVEEGLVKPVMHESGEAVLLARMPELVASEVAYVLAKQIDQRAGRTGPEKAEWLTMIAGAIPFGDIVVAQAIIDSALESNGMSIDLISELLDGAPRAETIPLGAKMAMHMPGVGVFNLGVRSDGLVLKSHHGREYVIPYDPANGLGVTYSNVHAWLILSHLAAVPFEVVDLNDESDTQRLDPVILLKVGSCASVLRCPTNEAEMNGMQTHDIPGSGTFVCHHEGIIEPITNSILIFLRREGRAAEKWIDAALSCNSMPLLSRIDIALRRLVDSADLELSAFAQEMLDAKIGPAFFTCGIPD